MTRSPAPGTTYVRYRVTDRVATIELDSPHNRNALSSQLRTELQAAIRQAGADPAVRVIVLGHTGDTFCSGADLKEGGTQSADSAPSMVDIVTDLAYSSKPVVTRVQGAVRAGGFSLLAAADIVILADDVDLALTEVRLGLVPYVVAGLMNGLVAPRRLLELALTGRTFTARTAVDMGLATCAVPRDSMDEEVSAYANDLAAAGPTALAETTRLLAVREKETLRSQLETLSAKSVAWFGSAEAIEGIQAFIERRRPSW